MAASHRVYEEAGGDGELVKRTDPVWDQLVLPYANGQPDNVN